MTAPLLEARDIWKRYPENGVQALAGVDLTVRAGSIHALVGENGAGKSTLIHVLAGITVPDRGRVVFSGTTVSPGQPAESRSRGIVVSYQHPRLVPDLTVLENLFMGDEPRTTLGLFDRREATRQVRKRVPGFAADVLGRRLGSLSSGQIRLVSLAAALLRLPDEHPGLLVLDEPTEASTPSEVRRIFSVMRETADSGHAIVFITHKLPEVVEVADTVTVLRHGTVVTTATAPFSISALAGGMLGSPHSADPVSERAPAPQTLPPPRPPADRPSDPGRETSGAAPVMRLALDAVAVRLGGRWLLRDVTIEVEAGSILGVTGIRENGIEALEMVLAAECRPTRGRVMLNGADVTGIGPRALRRRGLRYVPTDRLFQGASLDATVADNMVVLEARRLQQYGLLAGQSVGRYAGELARGHAITGTIAGPLRHLSGGNIQRVILARELAGNPTALVICEPGWGLDIAGRSALAAALRSAADRGAGVLVLSTDVDEVLELASSIAVVFDGRIVGSGPRSQFDRDRIGRLMSGAPDA